MKWRNRLSANMALLASLVLLASSCAVNGGLGGQDIPQPPQARPMEAGRLGLAPALRPFYDALTEFGDWILVEPNGWVFRPRVNTVAWRPYQDGHWEPSYSFGWVWESNDPFGWITDHYGFWFHDDFQGWVWQPYGAWAPSWVAWVQVGDFVGWAPLGPDGTASYDKVPGGVFTYVAAQALAQPSAALHASFVNNVPDSQGDMRPIDRVASYRGVYWNAGPDLISVLGAPAADRLRIDERDGNATHPFPVRSPVSDARSFEAGALEARTQRVVRVAQREFAAARARRSGATPDSATRAPAVVPGRNVVKPRPMRVPVVPDSATNAPGDSLRRARGGSPAPGSGER